MMETHLARLDVEPAVPATSPTHDALVAKAEEIERQFVPQLTLEITARVAPWQGVEYLDVRRELAQCGFTTPLDERAWFTSNGLAVFVACTNVLANDADVRKRFFAACNATWARGRPQAPLSREQILAAWTSVAATPK